MIFYRKEVFMKREHCIGYEVHTLDNMIGRLISSLRDKDGITQMQSWVIGYLYDRPTEDVFQKDIEAEFHIARSTATGIIQLMEKRGFLKREPVSHDARLKRLVLTEKGVGCHLSIIRNLDLTEERMMRHIPAEDLDVFFEVINQIKQNLEEEMNK